jgi:hypothetical protein
MLLNRVFRHSFKENRRKTCLTSYQNNLQNSQTRPREANALGYHAPHVCQRHANHSSHPAAIAN